MSAFALPLQFNYFAQGFTVHFGVLRAGDQIARVDHESGHAIDVAFARPFLFHAHRDGQRFIVQRGFRRLPVEPQIFGDIQQDRTFADPPALLQKVKVGEQVKFTLHPAGMASTVTAISPAG